MTTAWRTQASAALVAAALLASAIAFAQTGPAPHRATIPPGRNWFCFQDLQPAGGSIDYCARTQRACDQLRANRVRVGERAGQCGPHNAAATCFSYRDYLEGRGERRLFCARSAGDCSSMRTRLVDSAREQPVFREISDCAAIQ